MTSPLDEGQPADVLLAPPPASMPYVPPRRWGTSDTPSAHLSCLLGEFPDFFVATYPRLVLILKGRIHDQKLAEDIAQEAMLIAYQQWQRVCEADQPSAYVTTIAFRILSKFRFPELSVDLDAIPNLIGSPGVDEQIVMRAMLDWALAQLPQRQFDVIIRYYLMDQDTRSIADELGISSTSVRAHMFKALRKLRTLLKPCQTSLAERAR